MLTSKLENLSVTAAILAVTLAHVTAQRYLKLNGPLEVC